MRSASSSQAPASRPISRWISTLTRLIIGVGLRPDESDFCALSGGARELASGCTVARSAARPKRGARDLLASRLLVDPPADRSAARATCARTRL
jgi:hypothetical protein